MPRGIRVNAVTPGPTSTPVFGKLVSTKADLDEMMAAIPVSRFGNPSEIAQAIVFLASDEAAFTVGSELVVDGGMSNLWPSNFA
jgi:NAD(P)-dependent dehydrogenase (short-subunit alcohol dehydrogenase family)